MARTGSVFKAFHLFFNPEIYSKEAILRASYGFTHLFTIQVISEGSQLRVDFEAKKELDEASLADAKKAFVNEVLDHQLRIELEAKFGNIRDSIYTAAFEPLESIKIAKKKA